MPIHTHPLRSSTRKKKQSGSIYVLFALFAIFLFSTFILLAIQGAKLLFGSSASSDANDGVNKQTDQVVYNIPSGDQANQPLQASGGPSPSTWDGSSRITALFMGLDYRDWEAGNGASRTDSMMLVTYDPILKTAGILSIPRDLWVAIPGFGEAKINTAYYLGETNNVPGGGPALAEQTVEQFLGVPIDFYAQVDFVAFEKFIDGIGGLDLKIREPITIDPLGPGNTKTLEPGTQPLSGAETLAYARQRQSGNGDIDRAQRQQDVMIAIRNQILNLNMLPELISKSPQLYADVASGLRTNLTLAQVVKIAIAAINVPKENIKQAVIGIDDTELSISYDGQSILLPYMDKIIQTRNIIFQSGVGPTPLESEDVEVLPQVDNQSGLDHQSISADNIGAELATENARIIVLNSTNATGLANKVKEYLEAANFQVISIGNIDPGYTGIALIDLTGKIQTIDFLAQMMNIPKSSIYSQSNPEIDADIEVIIGENWQAYISLP